MIRRVSETIANNDTDLLTKRVGAILYKNLWKPADNLSVNGDMSMQSRNSPGLQTELLDVVKIFRCLENGFASQLEHNTCDAMLC